MCRSAGNSPKKRFDCLLPPHYIRQGQQAASLAQSAEQLICNQQVPGSTPGAGSTFYPRKQRRKALFQPMFAVVCSISHFVQIATACDFLLFADTPQNPFRKRTINAQCPCSQLAVSRRVNAPAGCRSLNVGHPEQFFWPSRGSDGSGSEGGLPALRGTVDLPMIGRCEEFKTVGAFAADKLGALFIFQIDHAGHAVRGQAPACGQCPKAHPVHLVAFGGFIHRQK